MVVTFGMASCNNAAETKTETTEAPATEATTPAPIASAKPIDPVCDMELDAAWTNYSVYNNDTVKFCSETCKTAFDGNPAKYASKIVTAK